MKEGFTKTRFTHDFTEDYRQLETILGITSLEELPLTPDNTIIFKSLFDFVEISGRGAFGMVIKVVDIKHADYAAIKVLTPI
jgi:hypothetical protein